MNKKYSIFFLLAMVLTLAGTSCSSDDDNTTTQSVTVSNSYTSTLVSDFKLGNNNKVLYNLDSVFFSIDQDKNLIYNADSLPKGTDVSHLTVSVTFPTAVGKAVFKVKESAWMENKEVEYSSETTDSIDFTKPVELQVTSQDGKLIRTYEVHVNVHNVQSDSLFWDQKARRDLPNNSGDAHDVKCVEQNGNYFCLLAESYGYVLSKASNPGQGTWERRSMAFDFVPDVPSFVASSDAFYILSKEGELFKSTDEGLTWTDCGVQWHSIKGAYAAKVLGVMKADGKFLHDEYPRGSFVPAAVDPAFPVEASSALVMASNSWAVQQQAMLMGGKNQAGEPVNTVWGYDGTQWGRIDNEYAPAILPALEGAALVAYTSYDNDSVSHRLSQRATWMVMGGKKADGTMNTTTYISYNQGITWSTGGVKLQLPSYIPGFVDAQAFVVQETLHKSRAHAPTQPVTQWECPYIYLVGGKNAAGKVYNNIWKGVINQLTFKPIH